MKEGNEDRLRANVFKKLHIIPFQHTYKHAQKILKLQKVEQEREKRINFHNEETNNNNDNGEDEDEQNVTYLDELSDPPESYQSGRLGERIEKAWLYEIKHSKRPSLFKVLIKTLLFDFIRGACLNLLIKLICILITLNTIRLILIAIEEITSLRIEYNQFLTNDYINIRAFSVDSSNDNDNDNNNNNRELFIVNITTPKEDILNNLNSLYNDLIIKVILLISSMSFYTILFSSIKLERVFREVKCTTMLVQLILKKSLKLNYETSINESSSKAINLLGNECTIIEKANEHILFLVIGPIIIIGGTSWIAYQLTGLIPILASYLLMSLSFLFQLYLPQLYKHLIDRRMEETKNRIELTTTFLNSIKVAKMYSWESVFRKIIDQTRDIEMSWSAKLDRLEVFEFVLISMMMRFLPTIIYITYIWINGDISATVLFISAMAFQFFVVEGLSNSLRAARDYIDIKTSCKKIETYLLLPENQNNQLSKCKSKSNNMENLSTYQKRRSLAIQRSISIGGSKDLTCSHLVISFDINNNTVDKNKQTSSSNESNSKVNDDSKKLKYFFKNLPIPIINRNNTTDLKGKNNIDIKLETPSISNIIDDLNIHMKQGELIIVTGQVGSGKSTLLLSLLGEIKPTSGSITMNSLIKIAYASQEPWILSDTIRNNILFGRTFNPLKYQQVIEVCALERDIKLLPEGDETLVGSKGVSLSGGQKARVNLARAIYTEADVYLFDDPISAVDSKVSQHLFNNCFRQYLKDKLVVLATHHRQYLKQATKIICLERGSKPLAGTYQELLKTNNKNFIQSNNDTDGGQDLLDNNNNLTIDELCSNNDKLELDCYQDSVADNNNNNNGNGNNNANNVHKQKNNNNFYKKRTAAGSMNGSSFDSSKKMKSPYYLLATFGLTKVSASIIILLSIIYSPLNAFVDYYLRLWRERMVLDRNNPNLNENEFTRNLLIGCMIYFGIATLNNLILCFNSLQMYASLRRASINLHSGLMNSLFSAKMSFYDFCPAGNLGSRYAGDFAQIDHDLKFKLVYCTQCLSWIIGFCLMVLIIKPICALLFIALFVLIGPSALRGYRKLMSLIDLSKQLRAPVYTNIVPIIDKLDTIRSDQDYVYYVREKFNKSQDNLISMSLLTVLYETRLITWVKLPTLVVMATTFYIMFVYDIDNLETAKTGVFFTLVNNIIFFFPLLLEIISTTEASLSTVDSVQQLLYLKPEEEEKEKEEKDSSIKKRADNELNCAQFEASGRRIWQIGRVEFKSVSLKYFADEKAVLENLSFVIEGGEKVGVVGRTGAGKSSIVSVLFRLYPIEGSVSIDGLNIRDLSLADLRSSLGVIPQDPILFCDSLRKNLDPFKEYTDEQLWKALEVVELKKHVRTNLPNGLDYQISEGGRNFSAGQRQLVCLARAILKLPKVLVMDEATANVDQDTDALIQNTIKRHFAESTVITIAHRLNTILDYDKVLVLDAGKIVEFDRVNILLNKKDGVFSSMVSASNNNYKIDNLNQEVSCE